MREKGNINIFVSCVSLIVSVLAVCIAAYRTPALSFDYQGVLMDTLSLLVTEAGIDVSISAIKEGLKGYDMTALALPMSHLLHIAKDCKGRKHEARIRKGKRMEYIKVLSNVKDPDADIVVDMLMRANEA